MKLPISYSRLFMGSLIAASTAALMIACNAKTLDVGTAKNSAIDSEDADSGETQEAGDSNTGTGLTFDKFACAVTDSTENGNESWPSWALDYQADCGPLHGKIRWDVVSRADLTYPQACSVASHIDLGVDNEGDAGTLYYTADATHGSCIITSGPSTAAPNAGVAFTATLVHVFNPNLTHTISYRAPNAP